MMDYFGDQPVGVGASLRRSPDLEADIVEVAIAAFEREHDGIMFELLAQQKRDAGVVDPGARRPVRLSDDLVAQTAFHLCVQYTRIAGIPWDRQRHADILADFRAKSRRAAARAEVGDSPFSLPRAEHTRQSSPTCPTRALFLARILVRMSVRDARVYTCKLHNALVCLSDWGRATCPPPRTAPARANAVGNYFDRDRLNLRQLHRPSIAVYSAFFLSMGTQRYVDHVYRHRASERTKRNDILTI